METGVLEKPKNLKTLLAGDPHVVNIIYPSGTETMIANADIGAHFNLMKDSLRLKEKENGKDAHIPLIKNLVDYIKAPVIIDNFENDDSVGRNTWENEISKGNKEIDAMLKQNRLKGGFIQTVLSTAEIFKDKMWFESLKSNFDNLYSEYTKKNDRQVSAYDSMTLEQKLDFTNRLALFAKELYKLMVSKVMAGVSLD